MDYSELVQVCPVTLRLETPPRRSSIMKAYLIAATTIMVVALGTGSVALAHKVKNDKAHDHAIEHKVDDYYGAKPKQYRHNNTKRRYGNVFANDNHCMSRWRVRTKLFSRGWMPIRVLDRRRRLVKIQAIRYNGTRFILHIDRCTGNIIRARPLPGRWWGKRYASKYSF